MLYKLDNDIIIGVNPSYNDDKFMYLSSDKQYLIGDSVINSLTEQKQEKIKQVQDKYQSIIDGIKSQSTQYEIDTWATQNAEWTAWVDNNNVATPFVDTLALARGIAREVLFEKIGNKVTAIAGILGEQQRFEDEINVCTTIAELDAIKV